MLKNQLPFFVALLCAFTLNAQVCFKTSTFFTVPNNNNLLNIASADMNKDGKNDILVADNGLFYVFKGFGNGFFAQPTADTMWQSLASMAAADFNNDGYTDVIATSYSNLLKLYFGDSTLTLIDSTFTTTVGKDMVEVGDFNKDGNMDFIMNDRYGWTGSTTNTLTLYSGGGNGSFITSTINLVNTVSNIINFKVADFNNDGYPDIAIFDNSTNGMTGTIYPSYLTILINDTLGSFTTTSYPAPQVMAKINVADLNNDGFVDIVAPAEDSINSIATAGIVTFMNNGGNGFIKNFMASELPLANAVLADFDGNGYVDLASRTGTYMSELIIKIAFNNGNGVFGNVRTYDTDSTNPPGGNGVGTFIASDFNNDSIPDLALINLTTTNNVGIKRGSRAISNINSGSKNLSCANASDGSSYLIASGSGSPFTYHWMSGQTADSLVNLPSGAYIGTVTANDGCKAIYSTFVNEPSLINTWSYATSLSCTGATGSLSALVSVSGGVPPYQYNFDNSNWSSNSLNTNLTLGLHNIVVRDSINCKDSVTVNLSVPPGLSATQEYYSKHTAPKNSVWADFNNDGFKDLATLYSDSCIIYMYLNNAGIGFSPPLTYKYSTGSPISFIQSELHAADVTGDNNLDLLIVTNKVVLCVGNGLGGFVSTNPNVASTISSIALGDFDNDLKMDFISCSTNNQILKFYKGNGVGGFTLTSTSTQSQLVTYIPRSMESIDVNNDGNLDLLISTSKFMVLLGNGTGGFAAPVIYTSTPERKKIIIKDLNYDGFKDVIITGNNTVQQFLGNALGSFTLSNTITCLRTINDIGIGDVDNDNVMDVVTSNAIGFEVHQLGNPNSTPTIINEIFAGTTLFVEDFNNDGNMDVIEQLDDSVYLKIYQNCLPLGITNNSKTESISIYPNPAQSIVNIIMPENSSEKSLVRVYDINGREVIEQKFTEKIALPVSQLSAGFYTVVVSNAQHTYRSKLVKNN